MSKDIQHESSDVNHECMTTFYYKIANMKAMKIVVLIRFSKLPYSLEQMIDEESIAFKLGTSQGDLTKQYEIISYIVMQSKCAGKIDGLQVCNLCGQDMYTYAKMNELLITLRMHLFPLLDEFYKYLLGHQKIKKTKYDSLISKIKKQITSLDATMNEHSEIFTYQCSFLVIIIMCELFIACKFVFEEKFRKNKYSLFNKYEKICKMAQFEEIYGKTKMCLKEYIPPQFQVEEEPLPTQNQIILPPQLPTKLLQKTSDRNQLLYNYFRSLLLTQSQPKKKYFPYFWMMFHKLECTLVHIERSCSEQDEQTGFHNLKMLQFELQKYLRLSLDYGMIGLYQQQDKYFIKGCLCLASKSVQELQSDIHNSIEMKDCMMRTINPNNLQQKNDVENMWENVVQHTVYEGVNLCMIVYI